MDNLKKELPSGAILEVQLSSFEEGNNLLKAVVKEFETLTISLGNVNFKDIDLDLEMNEEILNTLKNYVSRMISSEKIEERLWPCILRSRIDNKVISIDLFEKAETRGDYLVVLKEVLIYNLAPFFQGLNSLLSGITTITQSIQK